MDPKAGGSSSLHPLSGRDILCLQNLDIFKRTSFRLSKMNAIARAQLTFKISRATLSWTTAIVWGNPGILTRTFSSKQFPVQMIWNTNYMLTIHNYIFSSSHQVKCLNHDIMHWTWHNGISRLIFRLVISFSKEGEYCLQLASHWLWSLLLSEID